jgi:acetyl-CoA C-acetyltransferase
MSELSVNSEIETLSQKQVEKLNVNGGAIALGYPIAVSGARIVITMLHETKRRNVRYGLAALCGGGGVSSAMILEREQAK